MANPEGYRCKICGDLVTNPIFIPGGYPVHHTCMANQANREKIQQIIAGNVERWEGSTGFLKPFDCAIRIEIEIMSMNNMLAGAPIPWARAIIPFSTEGLTRKKWELQQIIEQFMNATCKQADGRVPGIWYNHMI